MLIRFFVVAMLMVALVAPAGAKALYQADEAVKAEAEQALGEILELWRGGRFAEVYDRTIPAAGVSREEFARRLAAARYRPACCWQKMQDVRVSEQANGSVALRARFGLESAGSEAAASTRTVKLARDGASWMVSGADLMKLAGAEKKKAHKKKRRHGEPSPYHH